VRVRYDMVQCFVCRRIGEAFEFLQLRRTQGGLMGGTWQSIYGGIKEQEKAYDAAVRELGEETGLVPVEFYQLDTVNTFYLASDDSIWNVPVFCAIVAPDAPLRLNDEHDLYRWISRDEFARSLMWPGERLAAAELYREVLDDGPAKPHLRVKLTPDATRQ